MHSKMRMALREDVYRYLREGYDAPRGIGRLWKNPRQPSG